MNKPKGKAGRPKGSRSKRTILREQARAAAGLGMAKRGDFLRGVEIMREAANYFLRQAKRAKGADDRRDAYKDAASIASDLAPYEDARLSAVTVTERPWDLSRLNDDQLAKLEDAAKAALARGNSSGESQTAH